MSSDSEKALAKYVEKMYELQFSEQENILTPAELKQIALEMGVTEQEWQESQRAFEGHLKNGKELIVHQNWTDAINSLAEAVVLNPYHIDALYYKAQAHVERFEEHQNPTDAKTAQELVHRALKIAPGHAPTLTLLSKLRTEKEAVSKTKKSQKLFIFGAFGLVIVLLFFGGMKVRNAAVLQEEKVNQAWAQVENVYQRRADLIPQLVNTVKSAANFEKDRLAQLTQLHQNLATIDLNAPSAEELMTFQQHQEALSEILEKLFSDAASDERLGAMEAFSNLQVQVEGSENRIAVERRKYNKMVQAYNSYIRQFPQNLLGFSEKGYFKASKKAMETPKVDL
ncbi:MAG: LemA family protein [Flammeovirgaceae bacterium]